MKKICIVCGGVSSEFQVSLETGSSILQSISDRFNVDIVHFDNNFNKHIKDLKKYDLVFNALHGGDGENGTIQAIFESNSIFFTGSKSAPSMIAMNKNLSKLIAKSNNIKTPDWFTLRFNQFTNTTVLNDYIHRFSYPTVVKPNNEGSTIGLSIIKEQDDVEEAIELASEFSNEILIEDYIEGRELTVAILGNKPLPIIEIVPKSGFYNYESKYKKGKTDYLVPAKLPGNLSQKIKEDALKIYKLIGCRHYARVDFRLDMNNEYYFLEINTLPGLTETSLFPMASLSKGLLFDETIIKIIEIASIDQ